jgi:hypothetical protein
LLKLYTFNRKTPLFNGVFLLKIYYLKLHPCYIPGVSGGGGGGGGAIGPSGFFGKLGPFFLPVRYQIINATTTIAAIIQKRVIIEF